MYDLTKFQDKIIINEKQIIQRKQSVYRQIGLKCRSQRKKWNKHRFMYAHFVVYGESSQRYVVVMLIGHMKYTHTPFRLTHRNCITNKQISITKIPTRRTQLYAKIAVVFFYIRI